MTFILYMIFLAGSFYIAQTYGEITPFVAALLGGIIAVISILRGRVK